MSLHGAFNNFMGNLIIMYEPNPVNPENPVNPGSDNCPFCNLLLATI